MNELIAIRRDLHMYPELGFQEKRTSKLIETKLKSFGVKVRRMAKTGVVGLIEGKHPGKTLLIRADMDGLPLVEENRVPYRSQNRGVMHA
jgi:amidohydrolase